MVDVERYRAPSRLVRGAVELTPAGELLAEQLAGKIALCWRDIVETGEPGSEPTKRLLAEQAELEAAYDALIADTVPGAHGAILPREAA